MDSYSRSSILWKIVWALVLVGYTGLVAYWMLIGFGRVPQKEYHYNFTPMYTIQQYFQLRNSHTRLSAINLLGNVAVFAPFGLLIPLVFGRPFVRTMGIFLLGDVVLELIQLFTKRGIFDVDDIILNTLGALIGYVLMWMLWFTMRKSGGTSENVST